MLPLFESTRDVLEGMKVSYEVTFVDAGSTAATLDRLLSLQDPHLKVYRRECFDGLDLYGEMHRFVPALMQWRGFRVAELPVAHHERRHGQTKYTIWRVLCGFLDMIGVNFWMNFSARPIHLFGTLGGVTKECQ